MALQAGEKGGTSGSVGLERGGNGGANGPACLGGAGRWSRSGPDQKHCRPAGSRRHRQATAGGQAEGPALAPGAQHHGADPGTSQCLLANRQKGRNVTHPGQKQGVGSKSHLVETGSIGWSDLLRRHRIQPPDDWPSCRSRHGLPHAESVGRHRIRRRGGVNVMQGCTRRLERRPVRKRRRSDPDGVPFRRRPVPCVPHLFYMPPVTVRESREEAGGSNRGWPGAPRVRGRMGRRTAALVERHHRMSFSTKKGRCAGSGSKQTSPAPSVGKSCVPHISPARGDAEEAARTLPRQRQQGSGLTNLPERCSDPIDEHPHSRRELAIFRVEDADWRRSWRPGRKHRHEISGC